MRTSYLNGWQRLWALFAMILFCLMASSNLTGIIPSPSFEMITHKYEFFDMMTDKAKEQLIIEDKTLEPPLEYAKWIVENKTKKGTPEFENIAVLYQRAKDYEVAKELSVKVRMPNNYILQIKKEYIDNLTKSTLSLKEYDAILKSELDKLKLLFFTKLFFSWIAIILNVYFFGWAINWVNKGFKK